MSLPPGFLDELRTRLSLTDVVGRKVTWEARKSNPGKGDMWAPCPFHHEKTASFHVDDKKGFYYCFGCQAKGDAISFVRETENVSFMEAVRILADEAGLQIPEQDPQARQKADERSELSDIMEQAVQFFRLQLRTGGGAEARRYLQGRGLDDAALERFEIGFAPNGWQGLWDHLTGKGTQAEQIFAAGLAKPSRKGGKPYDTFRNRIMFPIRDARGRAIAFGGRAMDPDDNAKYLNSPETLLFDKGRSLYNHGPARTAVGKGAPLIVAEGYMDVIALSEAGFPAAVAPLGTAVTEHQLQMMWRFADEPIIALDGDKAGLRAAHRVVDLALPLLEAGKSLRFAMMPDGQDPDDLIRSGGAEAVQERLDQALPMVDLLWEREISGKTFDSPERKAALDKALRGKIALISDPSIRMHYGQAIKDMRWSLFRKSGQGQGGDGKRGPNSGRRGAGGFSPGGWGRAVSQTALAATKSSLLATASKDKQREMREAVILASLVQTPEAVAFFDGPLEELDLKNDFHNMLRNTLLTHAHNGHEVLRDEIIALCSPAVLESFLSAGHVAIIPCVRRPGNLELAQMTVAEELAKLDAETGLNAEVAEAEEDIVGLADESVTWRLGQAAEAHNRALRSETEDRAEYDTGANGARINRDEKDAFDALLGKLGMPKQP